MHTKAQKKLGKILFSFLIVSVLFVSVFSLPIQAARKTYTQTLEENNNLINLNTDALNKFGNAVSTNTNILNKNNAQLEQVKNSVVLERIDAFGVDAVTLVGSIIELAEMDDPDLVDVWETVGIDIAVLIAGYYGLGGVAESVIGLVEELSSSGSAPLSEVAILTDEMSREFDRMSDQMHDIQKDIASLSNHVTKVADEVILNTKGEMANQESKELLREFMVRSDSGFSYLDFSNYLYATDTVYTKSTEAYYISLMNAVAQGKSDEEIKACYDRLFTALYENITEFSRYYYGEVIGMENTSISMHYYNYLSYNSDLLDDTTTAEYEALNFALEVYATYRHAYEILSQCYAYQQSWMFANNTDTYVYCEGKAPITKDIMQRELAKMKEALAKSKQQAAKDIAYILDMESSYTVMHTDDTLYGIANNGASFGNVANGQHIYLNTVLDGVCTRFYLDKSDFRYFVNGAELSGAEAGIVKCDDDLGEVFTATLKYQDTEIYQIEFRNIDKINSNPNHSPLYAFSGGSGSASDPYLISNATQLYMLTDYVNGEYESEYAWESYYLSAHYRLLCDIVAEGVHSPIGTSDEPFVGSFDGNGYAIIGLEVHSSKRDDNNLTMTPTSGMFGKLGGTVKNLTLKNLTVTSDIAEDGVVPENDQSYYYVGGIAGESYGTIYNCHIQKSDRYDSSVFVNRSKTDNHSRSLYLYVGGIVGKNLGTVEYCSVDHLQIQAESQMLLYSESVTKNRNELYVGGIAGSTASDIRYCRVSEQTTIRGYAKSVADSEDKKAPYLTVSTGGIIGNQDGRGHLIGVFSACKIEQCELYIYNKGTKYGEHRYSYKNASLQIGLYYPVDSRAEIELELHPLIAFPNMEQLRKEDAQRQEEALEYMEKNILEGFHDPLFAPPTPKDTSVHIVLLEKTIQNNNPYLMSLFNRIVTVEEKELLNISFLNAEGYEVFGDIVGYYGFLPYHEQPQEQSITVRVFFYAEGKLQYEDIDVCVAANTLTSVELLNFTTKPLPLGAELSKWEEIIFKHGFTVRYTYSNGQTREIYINDKSLAQIAIPEENSADGPMLKITYGEHTFMQPIKLSCTHHLVQVGTVSATCRLNGYEIWQCQVAGCGEVFHRNYTPLGAHIYVLEEGKKATCSDEGYTDKIYCEECGEIIEAGEMVQALTHEYVSSADERFESKDNYDGTQYHYCLNGDHYEPHQYTVRESVDEEGNLVYTYTCFCGYENPVRDSNILTDEKGERPMLLVTNGYVLGKGDTVVVFVQILNNPGFIGASFGIRYTDGLKLLSVEESTLVPDDLKVSNPVKGGYNFLWARRDNPLHIKQDGYLLKLTFQYTADIQDEHTEELVSVVYGMNGTSEGGFISTSNQYFKPLTQSGTVSVVDHLPGDVDNDSDVDIMDATKIAWSIVGKRDENGNVISLDRRYADVNLDGKTDLSDVIAILQAISGRYGTSLLSSEYKVFFELGGFTFDEMKKSVTVQFYDENGNRYQWLNFASFDDYKALLAAEGYTFVGWYTRMACTCTDACAHTVAAEDLIAYDTKQVRQTLYARFVRNTVVFEPNGATSAWPDKEIYDPNAPILNALPTPTLSYEIEYHVTGYEREVYLVRIEKQFEGWYDKESGERVSSVDLSRPNIGAVTLVAKWSDEYIWNVPEDVKFGYEKATRWYSHKSYNADYEITVLDDEAVQKILRQGGVLYGEATLIHYSVTYENLDNVIGFVPHVTYTVETSDFLSMQSKPTRYGYNFGGWYIGETPITSLEQIKALCIGDVTLRAMWTPKVYTITVKGINQNPLGEQNGVPTYATKVFEWPIYFTYGDESLGISQGFYTEYDNGKLNLQKKLDSAAILRMLENEKLSTNFTFGGLYYGGEILNNGHSYADVENKQRITKADGSLFALLSAEDKLFNETPEADNPTGTLYALILPKRYEVTLDINSMGMIDNIYNDKTYSASSLKIKYEFNEQTNKGIYTLPRTAEASSYCVIEQYVYLEKNTRYSMHMNVTDKYGNDFTLRVYYYPKGSVPLASQYKTFTGAQTHNFTVSESGYYSFRFDCHTKITTEVTVTDFWISSPRTEKIAVYYNEAFDTGVTMPTGVYYKATGYTVGNNSVLDYYFDSSGAPQKIYNLSGNTTLYCRWEQRYSGTYIKTEEELRAIGETGTYHIINDIVLLKEWIPIEIFSGYLMGHNHTIDGLKFTYTSDKDNYGEVQTKYGFIRELTNDGSVSNLTFRNLQISVTKYKDDQTSTFVGAVVGYITRGYLTNVHVVDSDIYANHFREVSSSSKSVNTLVGALAGYISIGTIADCSVSGNTTIYGEAGKAEGSAAARSFVGGIVGYSYSGNINECTRADSVKVSAYTTTVKSSSAECVAVVGGIVGGRDSRFADSTADCTSTLTNLSADGIASKGNYIIRVGYDCGWNYLF